MTMPDLTHYSQRVYCDHARVIQLEQAVYDALCLFDDDLDVAWQILEEVLVHPRHKTEMLTDAEQRQEKAIEVTKHVIT